MVTEGPEMLIHAVICELHSVTFTNCTNVHNYDQYHEKSWDCINVLQSLATDALYSPHVTLRELNSKEITFGSRSIAVGLIIDSMYFFLLY